MGAGDRVAYLSFNNHQLLEGYYGVIQARAIVMPLNVRLTRAELSGILNHAGRANDDVRRRICALGHRTAAGLSGDRALGRDRAARGLRPISPMKS